MNKKVLIGFLAGTAVGAFGGILFSKRKAWKKIKGKADGAPQGGDANKNKDKGQGAKSNIKDEVRSTFS